MEYKGYKIESIKNDGHLQRNAFGIYKNGKLISTATTSKEAQHEIDDIERELKDMKAIDKLNNAIKVLDSDFYQLKFYPSEKVEGTKQFSKEELDEYAKALLKKYGDKRVVITQMGKVYKTFYA